MVIAIVGPVVAGLLVSLLNKYVLSGQCISWLQQSCESSEEIIEEKEEEEEGEEKGNEVSSTNTIISDASVHIHSH